MVTGTSVLGIKFKDGIMLAADTLASYGSLAQIRDMKRLVRNRLTYRLLLGNSVLLVLGVTCPIGNIFRFAIFLTSGCPSR